MRRASGFVVAAATGVAGVALVGSMSVAVQMMPTRVPSEPTAETYRELAEHRRIRAAVEPIVAPVSVLKSY